ncbi:NADP-dependent phosphogluconate dehydrogenase [Flavobacteriaceae bacterium]|nr:NADP-dependent phosphogluconate dehydrogenase [Flavobacteriaceae bacterium]
MRSETIFVIGVSGAGKSTISLLLSKELNIEYFDGDDFHPQSNIDKMSLGQALNDEDRFEWLIRLNELAKKCMLEQKSCIIACSALKASYRAILEKDITTRTKWVFLKGSFEQIEDRLKKRQDHFMPINLLKSQFDILETPENAITIDIKHDPSKIISLIKNALFNKSEFGLFGLGVMGKSLARNLGKNGFKISLFNRHLQGQEEFVAKNFIAEHPNDLNLAKGFDDVGEFVKSLEQPRKIMLMVNAGAIIDIVIASLMPYLSSGDILIDGGNSNYELTKERQDALSKKEIYLIGAGVSGGEQGALNGPSIMPSGNFSAYKQIKPFLEKISAKDINDSPCCTYIGKQGSGHFVKMVHNGIEYVEMQLLAECYSLFKRLGYNPDQTADFLEQWNNVDSSYLLEITIDILRKKEGADWLINKIVDQAGNKGTGNWATIASAEMGMPSTLISAALFARYVSFFKQERAAAAKLFQNEDEQLFELSEQTIFEAYQFARFVNHQQGFKLIKQASNLNDWNINLSELARIWTNGCIIRSDLMLDLSKSFKNSIDLFTDSNYVDKLNAYRPSIKKISTLGIIHEIAIPCHIDAISFFNNYTTENSSANIIQAQRDYFGAHQYQRTDDPSGSFHHTIWNS